MDTAEEREVSVRQLRVYTKSVWAMRKVNTECGEDKGFVIRGVNEFGVRK